MVLTIEHMTLHPLGRTKNRVKSAWRLCSSSYLQSYHLLQCASTTSQATNELNMALELLRTHENLIVFGETTLNMLTMNDRETLQKTNSWVKPIWI